jgi:hypothetical protein
MLTDIEVADSTRRLLAEEMSGLVPQPALLADVRVRHARIRRRRHVTGAALACAAAAGVCVAGVSAATAGGREPAHTASGPQTTRLIKVDGYTVRVTGHLRVVTSERAQRSAQAGPAAIYLTVISGAIPAAAVRAPGSRLMYLLRSSQRLSVYLPIAVPKRDRDSLVLSSRSLSGPQLLRAASQVTIVATGR